MKPNDETIYSEQQETTAAAEEVMNTKEQAQQQPQPNGKKIPWKAVTIGGVTGILLGAAGMLGGQKAVAAMQDNEEPESTDSEEPQDAAAEQGETGTQTAHVSDDMSFSEAFAEARQQVGPGGVFEWRGGVYGTYYASEWNAMTPAEQSQFTAQAMEGRTPTATDHHDTVHHDDTPDMAERIEGSDPDGSRDTRVEGGPADGHNDVSVNDEPEVHFLGVEQHQTEDGIVINVGRMTIDSEDVAVIDMDDDRVFDVAVSDSNHNGELEDNEIIDISDRGLTVEDFAIASAMDGGSPDMGMPDTASQQQDDLAPDMPDYMSDADIQTI